MGLRLRCRAHGSSEVNILPTSDSLFLLLILDWQNEAV